MIDLGLSDDQQQILDGAVRLLEEHSPVSRLRPSQKRADVHERLAEWGWFGIGLPGEQGGSNLGIVEEVLLYFEAGRFLLSPSVFATTVAVRLVDGDLRSSFLDGRQRAALVIPGHDGHSYCFDRGDASHIVVAELDKIWLAPVEAFSGAAIDGLDEAVFTEKGRLDASNTGGGEVSGHSNLLAAAMLAGIARASCDLAVEYAKVRQQFGQPIGAFQAIKHICADMGLSAYAAEAQVKVAAVTAADDPGNAQFETRAAALTAMVAARANCSSAIQVHGGIGFTAECDVHFYLKRAHLLERLLGGLGHQQRALMGLTFPKPA